MQKYDFISNESTGKAEKINANTNCTFYTNVEEVMTTYQKCMKMMSR